MEASLLQDWITINGRDGVLSLPQSAHTYLDIGRHEDLVFYLDVRNVSGGPNIAYETSPTQQDASFLSMVAAVPLAVGTRVDRVMFATAAVPPARYVRWRLSVGAGNWSATFRVWLAAYAFS